MQEESRLCISTDEARRCDCNYKKSACHCSDSDCDWDPNPVYCNCKGGVDIVLPLPQA